MWPVEMTAEFEQWYHSLDDADRANVLACLYVLRERGPQLPRPYVDTVKGSRYRHMKELRIQSQGEPLRAFFAFSPWRSAILLCAGRKTGRDKRFYADMLALADRLYAAWILQVKPKETLQ